MDDVFLRTLFVQPRVVLGRRLLPFSAYHVAALMLLDSPFMEQKATVGMDDLVLAVFVCSYGSKEGPAKLFPTPDLHEIKKWGETHEWDFEAEILEFEQHVRDYLDLPKLIEWNDEGRQSHIPGPFQAVGTVLQFMNGLGEFEAWDMPFNRLIAYKSVIAENNGHEIVHSKAMEVLRDLGELDEKVSHG